MAPCFFFFCLCLGRITSNSEYPNCPVFEQEMSLHNLINWSIHRESQLLLRLDWFICLLREKFTAYIFRRANSTNSRKVKKVKTNKQSLSEKKISKFVNISFFFQKLCKSQRLTCSSQNISMQKKSKAHTNLATAMKKEKLKYYSPITCLHQEKNIWIYFLASVLNCDNEINFPRIFTSGYFLFK